MINMTLMLLFEAPVENIRLYAVLLTKAFNVKYQHSK